MTIDIDGLTEAELVDLNHRVVERLRFLQHMRAHASMLDFRIGERVSFRPDGRPPVEGMLVRYNRESVTVVTDDGQGTVARLGVRWWSGMSASVL